MPILAILASFLAPFHSPIFHRVLGVVTHFRTFYTCQSLFPCSLPEKFQLEAKNNWMIEEKGKGKNEADGDNSEEKDDIKLCYDDKTSSSSTYPNLKLNPFVLSEDRLYFEINAHCGDEGRCEGIIGVPEKEACLAHGTVADDQ